MIDVRHVRRGTIQCWIVDTLADPDAPTVAEITAGLDVTRHVRSLDGWAVEDTAVPLAVAGPGGYGEQLTIAGHAKVGVPTLTLYDEGAESVTVRTALDGATNVVWCLDGTPAEDDRAQVWPVVVIGVRDLLTGDLEPAAYAARFAVRDRPRDTAVIA